jgi:hypothetical protein
MLVLLKIFYCGNDVTRSGNFSSSSAKEITQIPNKRLICAFLSAHSESEGANDAYATTPQLPTQTPRRNYHTGGTTALSSDGILRPAKILRVVF